jgi:hypothetical protein
MRASPGYVRSVAVRAKVIAEARVAVRVRVRTARVRARVFRYKVAVRGCP